MLFNGRSVQVKVVKDTDSNTTEATTTVADLIYIVHETAKPIAKGVLGLMAAYILLDTARQVTVNAAADYTTSKKEDK